MKLSEKIQEALREQLEISLSDPAVQKRLAAHWGYVPAEAQPAPSVPRDAIEKMPTQLMDIAVSNGANSVSMPDEYVAAWLCAIPALPAPSVPEDVMRDAERYRYLRARDDDTAGVGCWVEADGSACDRGWLYGVQLDSAIDSFIEVLAAAPKPEGE